MQDEHDFVHFFLPQTKPHIIVLAFHRIKRHYEAVGEQLRISDNDQTTFALSGNVVIIPVTGMTKAVERSLSYANLIGDTIIAVHVAFDRESEKALEEKWKRVHPDIRLVTFYSQYRSLVRPLLRFIDIVQEKSKDSNMAVAVLIPQFITSKSWHNMLHNHSSLLLKAHLLYRKNVIVTTLPFKFKK